MNNIKKNEMLPLATALSPVGLVTVSIGDLLDYDFTSLSRSAMAIDAEQETT